MSLTKCCTIFKLVLILFFSFSILFNQSHCLVFKISNVHCESYNKTLVVVPLCRLKAINRNITVLNLEADILHPVYKIKLKAVLQKKASGYKPFLFNYTIDACRFLEKNNNPAIKLLYAFIKDVSNINHTCPYVGKQILKDFYLKPERLSGLPFPSGEYAILLTWHFNNELALVTNVYYILKEY